MGVIWQGIEPPPDNWAEIEAALRRIEFDGIKPDSIGVLRKFPAGRSGCPVFEICVHRDAVLSLKVVKIGSFDDMFREWHGFRRFFRKTKERTSLITPVETATPAIKRRDGRTEGALEAIVYDHVKRFHPGPNVRATPLGDVVADAVLNGQDALPRAVRLIGNLFSGAREDFYKHWNIESAPVSLALFWNRRLGPDASIELHAIGPHGAAGAAIHAGASLLAPLRLQDASTGKSSELAPGLHLRIAELTAEWWNGDLYGLIDDDLMVLLVPPADGSLREIAEGPEPGAKLDVCGTLTSVRAPERRAQLLAALGPNTRFVPGENGRRGQLRGDGFQLLDPFEILPIVLREMRERRPTSRVHGDLNPGNVLAVGDEVGVIDFAQTNNHGSPYEDFVRLEGCLAREHLPADFTWAEHIRLQRLLAVAGRLDDTAATALGAALTVAPGRPALGRAFEVLWAVRRAARDHASGGGHPSSHRADWARDYIEELFLFAHLSFKWVGPPAAWRAAVAMAGVATEALSDPLGADHPYALWSAADVGRDVSVILGLAGLFDWPDELARIARALDGLASGVRKNLEAALERHRAEYVRRAYELVAGARRAHRKEKYRQFLELTAFVELRAHAVAPRALPVDEADEPLAPSELVRREQTGEPVLKLLAKYPAAVLLGEAGSGKSAVAQAWAHDLEASISPARGEKLGQLPPPRLPVDVRAADLERLLGGRKLDGPTSVADVLRVPPVELVLGTHYVIIDAFNELPREGKERVAAWLRALRRDFGRTPVLVCQRTRDRLATDLPSFTEVMLQELYGDEPKEFIDKYLGEGTERAKNLKLRLLDDPEREQLQSLARKPLFLKMLCEYFRAKEKLPESRGQLFQEFSRAYLEQSWRRDETFPEPVDWKHPYERKTPFLEAVGFELVKEHKTELAVKQVDAIVADLQIPKEILDEIYASEMVKIADGKLTFMHQSFQEYFASEHFLRGNPDAAKVREAVLVRGFHDMLEILVGFAGTRPEVVRYVIDAARHADAALAARCLRMAESCERALLERFVEALVDLLKDREAGDAEHLLAARALFEYGRGIARAGLVRVARDPEAPPGARAHAIGQLLAMLGRSRFEPIFPRVKQELESALVAIFREPAQGELAKAAIAAVAKAGFEKMSMSLVEQLDAGTWDVRVAAWQALIEMGLQNQIPTRAEKAYHGATLARLEEAEAELFRQPVTRRIRQLNDERVSILSQHADLANLALVLKRRFAFEIDQRVKSLVDEIAKTPGAGPPETVRALAVLREPEAVDRWLSLFVSSNDHSEALAAAHRLEAIAGRIPAKRLCGLIEADLPPDRLCAVAGLVFAAKQPDTAALVDKRVRAMLDVVRGAPAVEAVARLTTAVMTIESRRGVRLAAVANTVFWTRRGNAAEPGKFPWTRIYDRLIDDRESGDYDVLLAAGGDDTKAAVHMLFAASAVRILVASDVSPSTLTIKNQKRFLKLAEMEADADWQRFYAGAAAQIHATELLPWLIKIAGRREHMGILQPYSEEEFGDFYETNVGFVLRAIGYLARVAQDGKSSNLSGPAIDYLHRRCRSLHDGSDPGERAGTVTGLGFVGEWEPILTWLRSGEPWLHRASWNVIRHRIPQDPENLTRVGLWIARRLGTSGLGPDVRSTLTEMKMELERKCGRLFPPERPAEPE